MVDRKNCQAPVQVLSRGCAAKLSLVAGPPPAAARHVLSCTEKRQFQKTVSALQSPLWPHLHKASRYIMDWMQRNEQQNWPPPKPFGFMLELGRVDAVSLPDEWPGPVIDFTSLLLESSSHTTNEQRTQMTSRPFVPRCHPTVWSRSLPSPYLPTARCSAWQQLGEGNSTPSV